MLQPYAVEISIQSYQEVCAAARGTRLRERRSLEKRAAEADRRIKRLTLAIADGGKSFGEICGLLEAQIQERDLCRRSLADLEAEPVVAMMPNLSERYRRSVDQLSDALSGDSVEVPNARQALRNLIDCIVATPAAEGRGVALEVRGHLAAMMALTNEKGASFEAPMYMEPLVAGTGFEPVTFRL